MLKLAQILLVFLPLFGFSQTDTIAHLFTFGGTNNDRAEEIEATSDGGYIVIGSTSSNSSGNTDAYLLKVDSVCNYEWSQAIGGANNDWGYSIKETFDKGFIVAATTNSFGNGGYNVRLMKRDSLGNYVWQKTYGGIDWDFAYSVVQTYDSGYVFCGETYNNSNGFSDVYIVKTNPLGDTLWTRTYGGALVDKGNCVIETSDSNIVVAGVTNTFLDSTQVYVLKLSPSGTLLWDSIYGDTLYESANSIIETSNGDFALCGSTTSYSPAGDKDFYMIRTDENGIVIWENYFGNPGIPEDDEAFDLYEDAAGNLLNVGYTEAAGAGMKDATLFYITSSGFWAGLGPTYGSSNDDSFKSFTIGYNGNFCMAGSTNSIGNGLDDVFIVRIDTIYAFQDTSVNVFMDVIPLKTNSTIELNNNILVYPNPVKSFLNIEIRNYKRCQDYLVEFYAMDGRLMKRVKLNFINSELDFVKFPKGFFMYKIFESNKIVAVGKLIVN